MAAVFDVSALLKVGLPRSLPYFFASLKVAITLAFVGTTVSEMTASNEGIGYLLISAGGRMAAGLLFLWLWRRGVLLPGTAPEEETERELARA